MLSLIEDEPHNARFPGAEFDSQGNGAGSKVNNFTILQQRWSLGNNDLSSLQGKHRSAFSLHAMHHKVSSHYITATCHDLCQVLHPL